MSLIRNILRPIWHLYMRLTFASRRWHIGVFLNDERRFWRSTHGEGSRCQERALAWITICYHIVEKGLTMPNRHLNFGKENIRELIKSVKAFVVDYGDDNQIIKHAIGTIKAYRDLHVSEGVDFSMDFEFWKLINDFLNGYPMIQAAPQRRWLRDEFYSKNAMPFDEFAKSRHTVRHYSSTPIELSRIKRAVALAMTAPSACNRQHVRVRCLCNRQLCQNVLREQGGNRGFGHFADKVLVLSADLCDTIGAAERNDAYLNGGIFLMNLCYSLHFYKIAHCILSCAATPEKDSKLRRLLCLPENEVFVSMICCGEAPDHFAVAESPRKDLSEIFQVMG